jgi:antitoxin (DNA-binding transcriptional repressor) of toxin-antitoxin stability system
MLVRAVAAVVAMCAVAASAAIAPASAAAGVITAGDRILVDGDGTCSVAYVYRRIADGHTYAITAGHCGRPAAQIVAPASGAVGAIVDAVVEHGGVDVGLVDFGTTVVPGQTVGDARWPIALGMVWPKVGDEVCRSGSTTGTHCGVVVARHGMHQYLTADNMRPAAGGDSGGAVWLKPTDESQHPIIVGIWLGTTTSASGAVRGRFHGLVDAFGILGLV